MGRRRQKDEPEDLPLADNIYSTLPGQGLGMIYGFSIFLSAVMHSFFSAGRENPME
jgi:hypothetical protein